MFFSVPAITYSERISWRVFYISPHFTLNQVTSIVQNLQKSPPTIFTRYFFFKNLSNIPNTILLFQSKNVTEKGYKKKENSRKDFFLNSRAVYYCRNYKPWGASEQEVLLCATLWYVTD